MDFQNIQVKTKEDVCTIIFNRPKSFNAFDFGLGNDFVKSLELAGDDSKIKAIIITGEGSAFCAGGDLAIMKSSSDTADTLRQLIKLANMAIIEIRRIKKPIIASINGAVGGVGMSIAAACDLRLCAKSAKFKQAYTSAGLVPDGGWTLVVPNLIGFGKACELAFIDPVFGSDEALKMGFVNKVFSDSELEQEAFSMARKIAGGPSAAFGIVKMNLNNSIFRNLENQLELEKQSMTKVAKTKDAREGIDAFFEKRKPKFIGK